MSSFGSGEEGGRRGMIKIGKRRRKLYNGEKRLEKEDIRTEDRRGEGGDDDKE